MCKFSIMIKIGPKSKRPIVICKLIEVSQKIKAVSPAEHAIVGIAEKGNETWKLVLNIIWVNLMPPGLCCKCFES